MLVGQVLKGTKWGPPVRLRLPEWARLSIEETAKWLGLDEKTVRRGFAEAEAVGCISSRRGAGSNLEYRAHVETFPSVPIREWKPREAAKEKPAPKPEAPRLPAVLVCPKGLDCPVHELVENPDGVLVNLPASNATPINGRTKGEAEGRKCPVEAIGHRTIMSTGEAKASGGHRTIMSTGEAKASGGHRTIMSTGESVSPPVSTKTALKGMLVARFGHLFATAPGESLIQQTLKALKGATLDHFGWVLKNTPDAKVTSWGLMPHLAADCAGGKAAWEAAQAPARPALTLCRDCGADCSGRTITDGRCFACAEKADAAWRALQPAR
jgi:hypothetical protein